MTKRTNEELAEERLKAWLDRALELMENVMTIAVAVGTEAALTDKRQSYYLVRVACIILRNWNTFARLEQTLTLSGPNEAFGEVVGVPLGIYDEDGISRTLVLTSADAFEEPPRANNAAAVERLFNDGLSPPPTANMTGGRTAAVRIGLARMIEHAACDLMMPLVMGQDALEHPLLVRARAVRVAAQHFQARDANWNSRGQH